MNHQAFAQLLGNYGEFVGAVAVVITLAFLTKQLRDSTRSANATAHSQRTSRNIDLMRWITDLDVARIREKIDIGSEVSPHEWSKVRAVDHAKLRHFEDLHYQKGLGLVDTETWEANMRGIRNMCGRPGFRESFEEGKFGLRRSFQALVEDTLNDDIKTRQRR
jgi:hypothetical protein